MNYQEYDWYFNPKDAPAIETTGDTSDPWASGSFVCIGDECCTKYNVYDASLNKCVPINYSDVATSASTTTESFINSVFTKHTLYPRNY
jgi:hypothetical protein